MARHGTARSEYKLLSNKSQGFESKLCESFQWQPVTFFEFQYSNNIRFYPIVFSFFFGSIKYKNNKTHSTTFNFE